MARFKDEDWSLAGNEDDRSVASKTINLALLMDIRDELKRLNALLHCPNFIGIPHKLDAIRRNTTKRKRVKRGGK